SPSIPCHPESMEYLTDGMRLSSESI
uniref:Uncharacterized protein n=1 Tax=Amphimedon queenslandica TaxID=400682 RepID=A0A1X7UYZ8_AMPQE